MGADNAAKDAKKRTPIDGVKTSHDVTTSNKQSEAPVIRNVQAIVDLERKLAEERKQFSRSSERFSKLAASPAFIAGHILLFAGWVIFNATHVYFEAFDPFPFDILNLILTFEAIILTSIVLIAQRELRRLADLRGHLDLQVNILAEQELTAILGLLNQVCRRLGIDPTKAEPGVEQLAKDTDVATIANAIEQHLND